MQAELQVELLHEVTAAVWMLKCLLRPTAKTGAEEKPGM
jgi:hypothetical protein